MSTKPDADSSSLDDSNLFSLYANTASKHHDDAFAVVTAATGSTTYPISTWAEETTSASSTERGTSLCSSNSTQTTTQFDGFLKESREGE